MNTAEIMLGNPVFPMGWTADELLDTEFPEPRWAVPGVVPEGLSLLVGGPKLGKSWLALNIAVAVAMGGCALGKVKVEAGTAVYLALEDPGRRLKDRLRIVLEGAPAPKQLSLYPTWPLLHDGGIDLLDAWLRHHPDCRLVVVDVLAKVRGTTDHREDRYTADYRAMTALKEIADRHGVAIIVVHHTRKASSEDYLDLVSGTNGLAGAADSIMILARSRGAADAKLHITGRDVEEAEHALKLNGGRWLLLDGPASDYEVSEQRRRILQAVRDLHNPAMGDGKTGPGPKAIANAAGVNHDVVKHLVRKMVDDGQLTTDGNGCYYEPPSLHSLRSPIGERSEWSEQLYDPEEYG